VTFDSDKVLYGGHDEVQHWICEYTDLPFFAKDPQNCPQCGSDNLPVVDGHYRPMPSELYDVEKIVDGDSSSTENVTSLPSDRSVTTSETGRLTSRKSADPVGEPPKPDAWLYIEHPDGEFTAVQEIEKYEDREPLYSVSSIKDGAEFLLKNVEMAEDNMVNAYRRGWNQALQTLFKSLENIKEKSGDGSAE